MLARFYQKSEPISFISLLFILFSFVVIHFFTPPPSSIDLLSILQIFGVFIFFTFIVLLINFIIGKNHLTPTNYYAILLFVLIIGLFPSVLTISKISLAHLFVLFAIRRLYSMQKKKNLTLKLFDSGFYLGIAFLLYPQTVLFILLVYAGYFIFKKIVDKNLLIPIIGFLTPLFCVFAYFYFFGDLYAFHSLIEINVGFNMLKITDQAFLIPFILLILILVYSIIQIFLNNSHYDNKEKNSNKLIITHFIISVFVVFLYNLKIEESIQFIIFPVAVLIGNSFLFIKKHWIKDILLYGLLILAFLLPFLKDLL